MIISAISKMIWMIKKKLSEYESTQPYCNGQGVTPGQF